MTAIVERPVPAVDGPLATPVTDAGSIRRIVAAALPTALTGVHAIYYGQWIPDDAGLSFAYARSLATGAGPVLQPGADAVEGFSNPAWVAVLVVGRWLRLFDHATLFGVPDVVMFPKLVALACCFGTFAAIFAIAATVTSCPAAITVIAGTALSALPSFVIWTTSGLENSLYALLVTSIAAVLVRAGAEGRLLDVKTGVIAGLLAAAAALTRPDGVVYVASIPLAVALTAGRADLRRGLRASVAALVAFSVPFAAYLGWRVATFGDFLPNTARAKGQGFGLTGSDVGRAWQLVDYVGTVPACLGAAIVALAFVRSSPTRLAMTMVSIPLGLAVQSFVALRPDWMTHLRFATPVWPLAAILVSLAAVHLARNATVLGRGALAILLLVAIVSPLNSLDKRDRVFRAHPTVSLCAVAQNHGYLFNGYADILGIRNGTLLSPDGGGTAMTSRLLFIDLAGLADRRIARFWQNDDMPGLRDYVLDDTRPTFVKLFRGWSQRQHLALTDDPRFVRDYLQLFAGQPGTGDWVRRDAIGDPGRIVAAKRWGADNWSLFTRRYAGHVPQLWWCGDTMRPAPFHDGSPAPSTHYQ